MTKPNVRLTKKQIVLLIVIAVCLCLFGILTAISSAFVHTQKTQGSVKTWDENNKYAMISIFIKEAEGLSQTNIAMLEYSLDNMLVEAAIDAPSENARLYVSSYSGEGTINISTERAGSGSYHAYMAGGDFFRFHPYTLISGSYLQEDSLMKDYIVLDKVAAWKLFGAIDVAGMQVTVGGSEYTVAGVVEVENGYLSEEGGAVSGSVWIPFSAMEPGEEGSAVTYEIIFPNPVTGFAKEKITEAFASTGIDEADYSVVENSNRYELRASLNRILNWVKRGMSFKEVAFPYWENSAVGVENIVDILTLFRLIFLLPPFIIVVAAIIRFHPFHSAKLGILSLVNIIKYGRKKI